MNLCVYGVGAIGTHLAVRLAQQPDCNLAVVARGRQLAAITERGLTLLIGDAPYSARPQASANVRELPSPALVVVTLKSHAIAAAADDLAGMAERGAVLLFVTNGIPWWYGAERAVALSPSTQAIIDPASLVRKLPLDRVVGCVAYSPNTVVEPGLARCASTQSRFIVGPAGRSGKAAAEFAATVLDDASIEAPIATDIRAEVWRKLLLNTALGPVAALTGSNNQQVVSDPVLREFAFSIMREVAAVAKAEGVDLAVDQGQLLPERLPPHKPSMLQDLEAGRSLETDSILRAVQALARESGVKTPALDLVSAMIVARTRQSH